MRSIHNFVKNCHKNLTLSDVPVSKISKVETSDKAAYVFFDYVSEGYRREIYVLEGKKTVTDFEDAISSMVNERWQDIFPAAPKYTTSWYTNSKTKK